jgi:hypothetical protein
VISSIVHIAHEYDNNSEPWPIEIENHRTGELVAVSLEPGQVCSSSNSGSSSSWSVSLALILI